MPVWKFPSPRALLKNPSSGCTSPLLGGRRYARRTNVERIFAAHAVSSELLAGRQTKMRRRLGESCGTCALYGPPISNDETIRGALVSPLYSRLQTGVRSGPNPSGFTALVLRRLTVTCRRPAFSGTRTSSALSAVYRGSFASV